MSVDPVAKRLSRLETRIDARHAPRLSPSRRRVLVDKAVREGDADALVKLDRVRSNTPPTATREQRNAAVAAAMRADQ